MTNHHFRAPRTTTFTQEHAVTTPGDCEMPGVGFAAMSSSYVRAVLAQVEVAMEIQTGNTPGSEISKTFLQGMANRMAVSFHKYGRVADAYPSSLDAIKSLQQRLDKYEETGNTEWLMDAANFAMIEFMCPSHPGAHFEGTDSRESPGRIDRRGRPVYSKHNLDLPDLSTMDPDE